MGSGQEDSSSADFLYGQVGQAWIIHGRYCKGSHHADITLVGRRGH